MAVISGNPNAPDPDSLTGAGEADIISGFGGADTLTGSVGADTLVGGDGDDILFGDESAERLGDGPNVVFGEGGNDIVRGGDNNDLLGGGAGNDTVEGRAGFDILFLTGARADYTLVEVTPESASSPGVYRITDNRPGSPDGSELFTGIESIRFKTGGEVLLADLLDRGPTDIVLSRVPSGGPSILETAGKGTFVALLAAKDPDPGERFTFSFAPNGDADGRFAIEGDKLVVGKAEAFDFEENGFHTVKLRVTDGAGNVFDKTVVVAVRDDVDAFVPFSAVIPADATQVGLWEHEDGGFTITWRGELGGQDGWISRRVDVGGVAIDPANPASPVGAPDRLLVRVDGNGQPQLLGVGDDGVAAFVTESLTGNGADRIEWIDADDGRSVKTRLEFESSQSASSRTGNPGFTPVSSFSSGSSHFSSGYFFDDGFVGFAVTDGQSQSSNSEKFFRSAQFGLLYGNASSGSEQSTTVERFVSNGSQQESVSGFSTASSGSGFSGPNGSSDSSSLHNVTGSFFDINEAGEVVFVRTDSTLSSGFARIDGDVTATSVGDASRIIVQDTAILDAKRFAWVEFRSTDSVFQAVFSDNGKLGRVQVAADGQGRSSFDVQALGSDKYLVSFQESGPGGASLRAQAYDASGKALSDLLSLPFDARLAIRDNGTLVAYTTRLSADPNNPGVVVDGNVLLAAGVIATPNAGAFSDTDGDGDLDFTGLLFVGNRNGEQRILRLEGGSYELTEKTLTVSHATVFANIGQDTGSAIFKGSFSLDRTTGVASGLVLDPLPASETPLDIAGLTPTIKSLTVRKEEAALSASFTLPSLLFGDGKGLDLASPNALVIDQFGPSLGGFEIPVGSFKIGGAPGGDNLLPLNLFQAKGKNIKVRYDGVEKELAFSGELEVTSDIVDALASLVGADKTALTVKDLKVKDGKVDFEGELSAKEWALPGTRIKLTDLKLGVKIDDDVLQSVGLEAGVELPFAQLSGLSFAGQVLILPEGSLPDRLFLNKIGLTATTDIAIGQGFFLDSIGASLDNLAPSPPEPTSLPTLFSGTLGIGWGPKIDASQILPGQAFLSNFADVIGKRPVNIELTAVTDWNTQVTGTGKINLFADAIGKHTGSITYDYASDVYSWSGAVDYFSGDITGTAAGRVTELGTTISGAVATGVPNIPVFGFLAGTQILGAQFVTQILQDGKPDNDFFATWGTLTIPVIGSQTVGFKVDLNTGSPSLILSANDIPKTNSFDVGPGEDWLMIAASWDNPVSGPVLTRVRPPGVTPGDPDNSHYIQEADYAAHGITVIDLYTGSNKKTIVIDDPAAGNWDLQIVDPSGLGTVSFHGYSSNPAVAVTIADATLALGALSGHVDATLTGVDPGTNVSFWADTDGSGLDGFALGSASVDADGALGFDFDARLLPGGSYRVYAVADDGVGAPAFDYDEDTIAVAHKPTAVTLAAATPDSGGAAALVAETLLPGAVIGALGALNPDASETHIFTLVDDAGGRFAIAGGQLVVGTGAPLDLDSAASLDVTVRATTSRGLFVDETLTNAVGAGATARAVQQGTADPDVLIGGGLDDVFFRVGSRDTVLGGGGEDTLFLDGLWSDFALLLDRTGALAGPVQTVAIPAGFGPDDFGLSEQPFDPGPPYLIVRDLRAPGAAPLIAAGIETLQFRDQRLDLREPGAVPLSEPGIDLAGTGEDETLLGGPDGDRIDGEGGDDVLFGFLGDDVLQGGFGRNQLFGGEGSDTASFKGLVAGLYADLRGGISIVDGELGDTFNAIENLVGGAGADVLVGDEGPNRLEGGAGLDVLFGMGGDDVLVGGSAPARQHNQLFGGEGEDTASYAGQLGRVFASIEGTGAFRASATPGAFRLLDTFSSIENLEGGYGPDVLVGDGGANRLTGGGGADQLYGRGGPDTFVYRAASDSAVATGYDVVVGFEAGLDRIDLSAFGIDASRLRIASNATDTALYADTDPAIAGFELAIAFTGPNALTLADIVF